MRALTGSLQGGRVKLCRNWKNKAGARPVTQTGSYFLRIFQTSAMATMTFQDVDVEAVADLSPEEVEEREVFDQEDKGGVEGPLLNFFLGGGESKVQAHPPHFVMMCREGASAQRGSETGTLTAVRQLLWRVVSMDRILRSSELPVWRPASCGRTRSSQLMRLVTHMLLILSPGKCLLQQERERA